MLYVRVALLRWDVPLHNRDAFDLHLGRVKSEHEREAVLWITADCAHRRISVDDDAPGRSGEPRTG